MNIKNIISKISLWAPPILWAIFIFRLSDGKVPSVSPVYWQDFVFKKLAHVIFYGIFSLLIYRGMIGEGMSKKKAIIWAICFATLYGATDEYHQSFTQGRESRVRDIGFDGIGAILSGYFIYNILPRMPKNVLKLAKDIQFL